MDKAEVICKLHEIADHYLLGAGTWPADPESLPAFFKTVRDLGLYEDVLDSLPGTTRSTPLGKELRLDLVMAFVGAWDMWEIPCVLHRIRIYRGNRSRGALDGSIGRGRTEAPVVGASSVFRVL